MPSENIIRKLREEKDLTQQELADSIGMSRDAVSAYERGIRKPSGFALIAMEKVFGVPAKMLYDTAMDISKPESEHDEKKSRRSGYCGSTR